MSYRETHNYINDTEIEVQQRRTSAWQLGLIHQHQFGPATLDLCVNYQRGTRWFGAMPAYESENEGDDYATDLSKILTRTANLNPPFALDEQRFSYRLNYLPQTSETLLTSPNQLSIGNRWTVRGFDGERQPRLVSAKYIRRANAAAVAGGVHRCRLRENWRLQQRLCAAGQAPGRWRYRPARQPWQHRYWLRLVHRNSTLQTQRLYDRSDDVRLQPQLAVLIFGNEHVGFRQGKIMNKLCYRIVFKQARQMMRVLSELARAHGGDIACGAGAIPALCATLSALTFSIWLASGLTDNQHGGALTLKADALSNLYGTLLATGGAQRIMLVRGLDNQSGQLFAWQQMAVRVIDSILNGPGFIKANGALTLATGQFDNRNTRASGQGIEASKLEITADSVLNQNGAMRAADRLSMAIHSALDKRSGLLSAQQTLAINATAPGALVVSNLGSEMASRGVLAMQTQQLNEVGRLSAQNALNLTTVTQLVQDSTRPATAI